MDTSISPLCMSGSLHSGYPLSYHQGDQLNSMQSSLFSNATEFIHPPGRPLFPLDTSEGYAHPNFAANNSEVCTPSIRSLSC